MTYQSDRDKFLDEFHTAVAVGFRNSVTGVVEVDSLTLDGALRDALATATEGWRFEQKDVDLNHLHDAKPDTHVRYVISTKARPLTEAESDYRKRRTDAYLWRGEVDGPPPPAEVPVHRLMGQRVWWRSRDGKTLLLKDMHPEHARNLLRMLERNAYDIHNGYLGIFLSAPDDVQEQAYAEDPGEWLRGTKFYRALRRKIRKDDEKFGREMREKERATRKATGK
jgi:hypothetical protein